MRILAGGVLVLIGSVTAAHGQFSAEVQRIHEEFEFLAPHRAFAVTADNKGYVASRSAGTDPARAIERVLKICEERQAKCSLHTINNVVLAGRDWKSAAPPLLPAIGRLRPQSYWANKGPQAAAGLIVWSHGYLPGHDATASAPLGIVGHFTAAGYDLYRFDRDWIRDWPGDATRLANAVRQAKEMGYRRVVLAGQSAGAWVSMAAAMRGAPADGVISIAAAHHGQMKDMRDVSLPRSDWHQIVRGIKPGPRFVVVNFLNDDYDVGGRMEDTRAAFATSGVQAVVISDPEGFSGHGSGANAAFSPKFGGCFRTFIEQGVRQGPCGP